MQSEHNAALHISESAFKRIHAGMKEMSFNPKTCHGFLVHDAQPGSLSGTLGYLKAITNKGFDPETLAESECVSNVLQLVDFELSLARQSVRVTTHRSEIGLLEELLNGMSGVTCEMEAYAADMPEVIRDLIRAYGNLDVRKLRIRNAVNARDCLQASANYALLEPSKQEELLTKYASDIIGFDATLKTDMGKQTLRVRNNGSISHSGDCPVDLVVAARDLVRERHQVIEIELVAL